MTMNIALFVVLPAVASAAALAHSHEHIVAVPMFQYKDDCGTKSSLRMKPGAAAMLQTSSDNVPGAGIEKFKPFGTVLKDGFMATDCIKDYMYYRGDKFGDNKYDYKLGPVSNVSIVHYDAFVAKEDQQEMTQKVCFEFCRTVPNMGFFGIVNGRNCYCTPYFEPMASDSSQCDAVCEGENTLMCGGKSKSSIFTMHLCADTEEDVVTKSNDAAALAAALGAKVEVVAGLSKVLQNAGEAIQKQFGKVGDSVASNHAQAAKVWAGELEHSAEDAEKLQAKLPPIEKFTKAKDATWKDSETVTKAERFMENLDELSAEGELKADELDKQIEMTKVEKEVVGAAKQYYSAMYFVDKDFVEAPSTCNGDVVGKPRVGSKDACATMCDAAVHSCVGFQFSGNSCVLLSSFKEGFYYTKCGAGKFLQTSQVKTGGDFMCYAKLSKFEGTTLKPDPSGKCKQCFKTLTKADRCPFD